MYDFDDRLDVLLDLEELAETALPEVYSSVQTIDEPDFVENRKCAVCVGECKVH